MEITSQDLEGKLKDILLLNVQHQIVNNSLEEKCKRLEEKQNSTEAEMKALKVKFDEAEMMIAQKDNLLQEGK